MLRGYPPTTTTTHSSRLCVLQCTKHTGQPCLLILRSWASELQTWFCLGSKHNYITIMFRFFHVSCFVNVVLHILTEGSKQGTSTAATQKTRVLYFDDKLKWSEVKCRKALNSNMNKFDNIVFAKLSVVLQHLVFVQKNECIWKPFINRYWS